MSSADEKLLEAKADELAWTLTDALEYFADNDFVLETVIAQSARGNSIVIQFAQKEDLPKVVKLKSRGWPVLGLGMKINCTWDSQGKHLAVEKSSIRVMPYGSDTEAPLFRVEYVKDQDSHRPSSPFMSMRIVMSSRISWALLPNLMLSGQRKCVIIFGGARGYQNCISLLVGIAFGHAWKTSWKCCAWSSSLMLITVNGSNTYVQRVKTGAEHSWLQR